MKNIMLIGVGPHAKRVYIPAMEGITAGHEVFGTVVGVGKNVQKARIGDILCPDSHYSCSIHSHFDDCVNSGNSCDGIVGGIKYSNLSDTHRDGYWAQCAKVHKSSFTKPIPPKLLKNIPTASILESLGNIFEIFITAKQNHLLHKRTIAIIVGLGATGYQLANILDAFNIKVIGIEPNISRQKFAASNNIDVFAIPGQMFQHTLDNANLLNIYDSVVVFEMSGKSKAFQDSVHLLQWFSSEKKKSLVLFGLSSDNTNVELIDGQIFKQNSFVLERKKIRTSSRIQVIGVCGRSMAAWNELITLLSDSDERSRLISKRIMAAVDNTSSTACLKNLLNYMNSKQEKKQESLKKVFTFS